MPRITIITVALNCRDALEKTTRSVAEQTFADLEHVIIDGASTDGTREWLQSLPSKTRWVSEPDTGIYNAMNKGVRMASGEWVCFMNAGDVFVDNEVCEKVFGKVRCECDVVFGDVIKNGKVYRADPVRNLHRMPFCHQSSFVRIERLREMPFDESLGLSGDYKFFKQMIGQGCRFEYVPLPVCIYDTSGLSNIHRELGIRENIRVVRELDRGIDRVCFVLRLYCQVVLCKVRAVSQSIRP